ncbi:MAG: HAD hydrolase-like protein [Bacteroidetes bacterium]|nr:HAD hydrolase-like protein [Bacteroidota bacterium]MCL1968820.1 HAD hydrolase-like protein [Bacteroidota bacterium]
MIKLIIFDLDGTLLNTLDDLADCTNYVLQQNRYPTHKIDAYKYFVGNGVEMLLRRALPKDITETAFAEILQQFMNYYEIHKADKTAPYEGIIETLEKLQQKEILLAVATNKPHELLPELMQYYFPTIKWAAVFGNRKDVPIKPHPQIVYDILNACKDCFVSFVPSLCPLWLKKLLRHPHTNQILYVGDTAVDMETAQNAGIKKVGALWGFRTKEELLQANADYIMERPQELIELC